jgi:hypothetical protein
MVYRDLGEGELDAARRAHLEAARTALESIRTRKAELDAAELAVAEEIDRVDLEQRRRLPVLPRIEIASPCDARWEDMRGSDTVRRCAACSKDVHDLSAMTLDEAARFLATETARDACMRLFLRDDGRFLTGDCPVGIERRRRRRALPAVALAALVCGLHFMGATLAVQALIHAAQSALEPPPAPCYLPEVTSAHPPPPRVWAEPSAQAFLHVHGAPGVSVSIDGRLLSDGAHAMTAGTHAIYITTEGKGFSKQTLLLARGEHHHLYLYGQPQAVPEPFRHRLTGVQAKRPPPRVLKGRAPRP